MKDSNFKVVSLSLILLCGLFVLGLNTATYAADPIVKLSRGITNAATGWLEIPKEIGKQLETSGDVAGIISGPLKGLAKGIGRTLAGVYDIVTFIIPLPRNYEPLMQPEYVFKK